MVKELVVKTKNYKIQIFALGYRGGITLSLHGAVDIDPSTTILKQVITNGKIKKQYISNEKSL